MKITIELDPLTAYYLAWLGLFPTKGKWESPDDIIRPLIAAEFGRLNPNMKEKQAKGSGGSDVNS